jgi:hypothetical protein
VEVFGRFLGAFIIKQRPLSVFARAVYTPIPFQTAAIHSFQTAAIPVFFKRQRFSNGSDSSRQNPAPFNRNLRRTRTNEFVHVFRGVIEGLAALAITDVVITD